MIKCPHCGENVRINISDIEDWVHATNDTVELISDCTCPNCKGVTRVTQIGHIKYWDEEIIEAV